MVAIVVGDGRRTGVVRTTGRTSEATMGSKTAGSARKPGPPDRSRTRNEH
jgi:hypothetical protein